jgi:hypothetical protein
VLRLKVVELIVAPATEVYESKLYEPIDEVVPPSLIVTANAVLYVTIDVVAPITEALEPTKAYPPAGVRDAAPVVDVYSAVRDVLVDVTVKFKVTGEPMPPGNL